MLISQRIENFLGGVSQVDERLRRAGAGSLQLNCLSDPANGLRKRPPLVFDAQLELDQTVFNAGGFVHTIDRDIDEKFRLVVRNGGARIFRDDGTEFTIYSPEGLSYLTGSNFRALTLGNTTFVINQDTEVATDTAESAQRDPEALIFVRQADYSTSYKVTVDGYVATHITPASDAAEGRIALETFEVARALHNQLLSSTDFASRYTTERFGSTIYVKRVDGGDFDIDSIDGLANKGLLVVKDTVQRVEDLPFRAKDGFIVEVTGDPGTPYDNHWMVYDESENPEDYGVWRETVKPGVPTKLDRTTMPHELILSGAFTERGSSNGVPSPPIIRGAKWTQTSVEFDTRTDSGGSTAITSGNEATIEEQDGEVSAPVPAGTVGNETEFEAFFQADTARMDPSTGIRLVLEIDDGLGSYTAIGDQVILAGQNNNTLSVTGTATPASGATVRLRQEYLSGSTPTDIYRRALTVVQNQPTLTSQEIDLRDVTIRESLTPMTATVQEATSVSFGVDRLYPDGYQIRLTVDGTNFDHTPSGDETGETVATALQALVDANVNFDASNPNPGEILITQNPAGTAPVVTHTYTFDPTTHAWFDASSLDLTGLTGLTGAVVRNVTDGSTGTITSTTATSIVASAGLTGGIDNTFEPGDLVEIEQTGNYYVFRPARWRPREVGDLETNPWPEFVGDTIRDMAYHQGRLVFVFGDQAHLSGAGDLVNLFRQTNTLVKADDSFGVQSASPSVSEFHSAVEWDRSLYLVSENGLTWLNSADQPLTPSTVRMDPAGAWANTPEVPPVVLGNQLYLVRNTDEGVQVLELFKQQERIDGRDITSEILYYMQGAPEVMFGSAALGMLLLITNDAGTRNIYVYSWADQGQDRVMSSWSQWTFPALMVPHGGSVVDGKIGLVFSTANDVELHTMDPVRDLTLATEKIAYLDRRVSEVEATPAFAGGITTWTLPYEIATDGSEGTLVIYNRTTNAQITVLDRPSLTTVRATGDFSATNVWIGVTYTQQFDPNTIYYRDPQTDVPDTRGRVQVLRGFLEYHDSTDFDVTVTPTGKAATTFTVAEAAPTDGILNFPVLARNTEVSLSFTNDTPGSANITALEWEGRRVVRSRR